MLVELAPPHVQSASESRGKRVRAAGLAACCIYFSKKKKKNHLFCIIALYQSIMALLGSIPHEIGTLSKLTYLTLSQNNLDDELPISLAMLTQLVTFDISYN